MIQPIPPNAPEFPANCLHLFAAGVLILMLLGFLLYSLRKGK